MTRHCARSRLARPGFAGEGYEFVEAAGGAVMMNPVRRKEVSGSGV